MGSAPGRSLPSHGHGRLELTQVLCSAFADGRAVFGPGDFDAADGEVHHRLVAQPGSDCLCLVRVDGRVRFDGRAVAATGRWLGV